MPAQKKKTDVGHYSHKDETGTNIPPAEAEPDIAEEKKRPIHLEYERSIRNVDLDPQLVWKGKDEQDRTNLTVMAPTIYGQEKIHPRVLIEDLIRQSGKEAEEQGILDLFNDFNGLEDPNLRQDYYNHDQNWSNRMILGDSLQVMASLSSREGYQAKVQCIYIDPPYGIRFNSNFQWSTTSRDVRDGNRQHISREPEQVKAFRDTWREGVHSYLTYLRDRLTVARDLLDDSGSIFVQIGEENVHRVRAVMDEVFNDDNFVSLIAFNTTSGSTAVYLSNPKDYVLWYAKRIEALKFRRLFAPRPFNPEEPGPYRIVETQGQRLPLSQFVQQGGRITDVGVRLLRMGDTTSQRQGRPSGEFSAMGFSFKFQGKDYRPSGTRGWSTTQEGLSRAAKAGRLHGAETSLSLMRYFDESPFSPVNSSWDDTGGTLGSDKTYIVQTNSRVIERCILMTSDPGDLVLDPTCGSGTTPYVAEQWGRRWITIDTSRVALALARARIMGARYPYYTLADSREGQLKEAELSRRDPAETPTYGNVGRGFVYERVPHITLRDIANNAEIDVIWEKYQEELEPLREGLNQLLGTKWEEWEIPQDTEESWTKEVQELHRQWWDQRIARQKETDASIAAKAQYEYLYNKPYENRRKVRVAGPFTVESLSPHRLVISGDTVEKEHETEAPAYTNGQLYEANAPERDFAEMIIENLRTAGVQQANKEDKIAFTSITGWPGEYVCAEGQYTEGDSEKRAAIFIGPEFGTIGQADLNAAAREAGRAKFDALIACGFSYDAQASDLNRFADMPILKARLSQDLHMSADLKNTGQGNLFVIFGEPDIEVVETDDGSLQVSIKGVDIYDPSTGQVRSDDTDRIACWFIDTDYNEESFFVRHAYFLGAGDPYKSLKTTLKAEIDQEAWSSLNSEVSRPFPKPNSGRIAVKVINHLGDEAMKVVRV